VFSPRARRIASTDFPSRKVIVIELIVAGACDGSKSLKFCYLEAGRIGLKEVCDHFRQGFGEAASAVAL
jgi:hypothetical protein